MLIALWLPAAALGLVATTPASPPLRSVAAVGARTSSLEMRGGHAQSSPNTLMQPPDRQVGAPKEPQTEKAVGRLLSVELSRISERLLIDGATPTEALTMLKFWVSTRRPILEWSIGGLAGVRNPGQWNPTLTKLNRELAAMRGEPPPPDLTGALLSLQRPIRSQVREGWRHSPLRIVKVASRSISLLLAAGLARAFPSLKAWWQRRLAKALDSYAAQLEANPARHRAALWPKAQERFWDSVLSFYAV